MTGEQVILLEDEDENVILEGSELHQALTDLGYKDFDAVPRINTECDIFEKNFKSDNKAINNDTTKFILQDRRLRKKYLQTILEADILLDDHAVAIADLLNNESSTIYEKFLEWFPFISTSITASIFTLSVQKKNILATVFASTVFGFSIYKNIKCYMEVRNLKLLVSSQNDLHNLVKQGLKILRRAYGKKSIIPEVHEKQELMGNEKHKLISVIRETMVDILEYISRVYYFQASDILKSLPHVIRNECILTEIETENDNEKSYEKLKNLYYSFILVQSEMMFIIANAYNGKFQDNLFYIPKAKLSMIVDYLREIVNFNQLKISETIQNYQLCEIQPIKRVFRGLPTSKWQDTYMHLNLTSQKIQMAYKEITSILETLDLHPENDEDNNQLVEIITEKMNEAYKQIENARSFAEFSSLLIAKAQRKPQKDKEIENQNENLFPDSNEKRIVITMDDEPEIEDEVFEEYIKEEYLKPLYENDPSIIVDFKIDKLLKKHFMSELKGALIEKQKSMSERELKALKRMYDRVRKDTNVNRTEVESTKKNEAAVPSPVTPLNVPPPPPPPPPIIENPIIAENDVDEIEKSPKKGKAPIPLPRGARIFRPEDELPDVQRFSIADCTPKLKFPALKLSEETFLGSGENSEEEDAENSESEDEDEEEVEN